MRTYGKDTPEFFEFKISGKKKTYRIPTQASISYDLTYRMAKLAEIEDTAEANAEAMAIQMDILTKYIGEEARDFPTEAVGALFLDWATYSEETSGVSAGELQGSSE